MIYFFYDIFLLLASLLYLPIYAIRKRVHHDIFQRLGFFSKDFFKNIQGKDVVWLHAVSVGEARAAESLLQLMRSSWPDKKIVVSTVTPTGQDIVKRILKDGEISFYAPLDVSWIVSEFLKYLNPSILIIMETELWPNLIRLSSAQGTKVVIVNGRISDKSYRRYQRIKLFLKDTFKCINMFCMQTQESVERIIALGALPSAVRMTGNIKFDISADIKAPESIGRLKNMLSGNLLFVAGSTHEGEEEAIVEIFRSVVKDFPHLRLLIAPRHLDRLEKIRRMIKLKGFEALYCSRVTQLRSNQIILLNTMGDLTALYGICDVAFVGGSFNVKGGHNPIEPALFAKPVMFGSHMENFRAIRDVFIREHAAIEVENSQQFEYELRRLLASPGVRKKIGDAGKSLLDKNRGAANRTFLAISEVFTGVGRL